MLRGSDEMRGTMRSDRRGDDDRLSNIMIAAVAPCRG
jgi:hypothetical protein